MLTNSKAAALGLQHVLAMYAGAILVPLLIKISISLSPDALYQEIKAKVNAEDILQKKWYLAIPVILIYIGLSIFLYYKFFQK